jgi:uncharacterized protein (TIGR04255 family)
MTTTQHSPVSSHGQGPARIKYHNPPVAETSLGFFFDKVEGWHLLHQGLLWANFRASYPNLEFFPPIVEPAPQQNFSVIVGPPVLRTGFSNQDKTQLVQIQDGLLFHNWRKTAGLPEYMRYDKVRAALVQDWTTFRIYLRDKDLKQPSVTRCEMTYFNHLLRGSDWQDLDDLARIFTVWRAPKLSTVSAKIQTAAFNVQYQLAGGSVLVGVQPAIRTSDGKEIIQFSITSAMVPKNSDDDALFQSLDECHENAQRIFADLTTDEARERWNKQ